MKWVRVALHWEPLFCFSDLWVPLARLGSEGGCVATWEGGSRRTQAPAPMPSDVNQGLPPRGPHFPSVEPGDFWAASYSGSAG